MKRETAYKFFVFMTMVIPFLIGLPAPASDMPKPIPVASVQGSGPFAHDASLMVDGKFVYFGSDRQSAGCVAWEGTSPYFILDLGAPMRVQDLVLQLDGNDTYRVDYSVDGEDYSFLLMVKGANGNADWGMDTFSTRKGDLEYVRAIDFGPFQARFLKVFAVEGDDKYSISEVQVFGSEILRPEEPGRVARY